MDKEKFAQIKEEAEQVVAGEGVAYTVGYVQQRAEETLALVTEIERLKAQIDDRRMYEVAVCRPDESDLRFKLWATKEQVDGARVVSAFLEEQGICEVVIWKEI